MSNRYSTCARLCKGKERRELGRGGMLTPKVSGLPDEDGTETPKGISLGSANNADIGDCAADADA